MTASECNPIYHLKILRAAGYLCVEATGSTLVAIWQFLCPGNFILIQTVHDSKVCLEKQAETVSVHAVLINYHKLPALIIFISHKHNTITNLPSLTM
jgi:hypothetical protein